MDECIWQALTRKELLVRNGALDIHPLPVLPLSPCISAAFAAERSVEYVNILSYTFLYITLRTLVLQAFKT